MNAHTPETNTVDDIGAKTMFAVSGRNQLQLIAIADKKANMITVISSITIFLIIALFTSESFLHEDSSLHRLEFILPLSILLAFSSVSLICAVMALKPKIIRVKKESRSALFFHNYYRNTLEEYKASMKEMMKNRENVYEHMLTDMYFNGLVLERKYALLSYAYTLFLLAILLSVSSFVITILI